MLYLVAARPRLLLGQSRPLFSVDLFEVRAVLGVREDQALLLGHPVEDFGADLVRIHPFLERGAELLELGALDLGKAALADTLGPLERAGPGVGAGQRRAAQRAT